MRLADDRMNSSKTVQDQVAVAHADDIPADNLALARWHLDNLWYRPMRSARSSAELAFWNAQEDRSFVHNALPVAVRCNGTGPVIVLLHGFSGRGSQFMHLAPALQAGGFRVVSLDLPGCGDQRVRRLSVQDIAGVLIELGRREGPLHGLVAHSMANVWCWYAMAQGLRTQRFVALSGVYDSSLCYALYRKSHDLNDGQITAIRELLAEREGVETVALQNPAHVMNILSTSRRPAHALIVQGCDDELVPQSQGQAYAAAWPEARYVEIAEISHAGLLVSPATVTHVTDFFLQT